jgi:sugar fermentation stimulation protein A
VNSPLVSARFVRRPNRFIVEAKLSSGEIVATHLADPGRLKELLLPGAELRLTPVPEDQPRKTRYTVALVRSPEPPHRWVSVNTALPNRLAAGLIAGNCIESFPRCEQLRREVNRGRSRFDFLLTDDRGAETWVEVKSVTLVEDGVARFPDAPTSRGTRHVRELTEIVQAGGNAVVLFVVQRDDACEVQPNQETDPEFSQALAKARQAGVGIFAVRFRLNRNGTADFMGSLPVVTLL